MLNPFKKKRPETSAQTDMKQEKATPSKLPFDYKPSMQELETKSSKKKYGSGADKIRVKKDPIDKLTPVTAGLAPIPASPIPKTVSEIYPKGVPKGEVVTVRNKGEVTTIRGNNSSQTTTKTPSSNPFTNKSFVGPPTEKQMVSKNEDDALDKVVAETSSAKVNRPGTTHSIAQVQDMEKVKQHQEKLNKYGANLKVDGMWGAKTAAASRELYPKYKTQSTTKSTGKSAFKSKAPVSDKQMDGLFGSSGGKETKSSESTTKQAAPKLTPVQANGTPITTTSSASAKPKTKGLSKPVEPEYDDTKTWFGKADNADARRALNKTKKDIYDNQVSAYNKQENDRVIDKSDSLAVANGLEPSTRYKSKKFNEVLADQQNRAKNGKLFNKELDRQNNANRKSDTDKRFNKELDRQNKGYIANKMKESYAQDADNAMETERSNKNWSRAKASADSSVVADKKAPSVFKLKSVVKADTTGNAQSDKNWQKVKEQANFETQGENYRKSSSRVSSSKTNKSGGLDTSKDTSEATYKRVFGDKKARKDSADAKTQRLIKRARSKGIKI